VLLGGALLAAPLLLLNAGPSAVATEVAGRVAPSAAPGRGAPPASPATVVVSSTGPAVGGAASPSPAALPHWQLVRFRGPLTAEEAQAAAEAPTTTAAPPTTTTTTAPPPTTTTTTVPAPPTTTTTTAAPVAVGDGDSEVGGATWYAAAPPGYCASPTLAFGTELEVVNNATGASTTCTVDDREADNPGRVVDLSPEGFAQIADLSAGVVEVTISW
jgi:hypothetical protein